MSGAQPVDPSIWTHSFPGDQGKYRDVAALKKAIDLKCSVIFDEYYRYSLEAKELVAFIQEEFNCTSGCNAYLSQKGGTAFSIHRDCHHVLVFALTGEKRWRVYNKIQSMNQAYNRIPSSLTEEEIVASGLYYDVVMKPGDILYIPIGQFHSVENLSNNALHLTISMSFKPLFEIIEDLLSNMYDVKNQSELTENAVKILNELHPIYYHEKALKTEHLVAGLKQIFELLQEIASQDTFVESQNVIKRNKHLEIFRTPTDQYIEELITCSE